MYAICPCVFKYEVDQTSKKRVQFIHETSIKAVVVMILPLAALSENKATMMPKYHPHSEMSPHSGIKACHPPVRATVTFFSDDQP